MKNNIFIDKAAEESYKEMRAKSQFSWAIVVTRYISEHKVVSSIAGLVTIVIVIVAFTILGRSGDGSEELIMGTGRLSNVEGAANPVGDGEYDYKEAVDHIGEKAVVTGTVNEVFTSKSGTVFLDFCDNYEMCPFSAVIFASDVSKFEDLEQYKREVKITGTIKSYQGRAEIIINGPEQIE